MDQFQKEIVERLTAIESHSKSAVITLNDHEERLRSIQRFIWSVPIPLILAVLGLVYVK